MDQKLKQHLEEESNYSSNLKEEMWAQIESQLENGSPLPADSIESQLDNKEQPQGKRRKRTMTIIKATTGLAAAVIAVTAFLALPPGETFMKSVQNWFAPEKKIEVEIEGNKEETNGQVHVNEESRYAIYYDKERYKLIQQDGKDVITTIDPLPEPYPQVSLTIEQNVDALPEKLAAEIAGKLADQFAEVRDIEKVSEPVEGYRIHAINGHDRLSEVISVYVTSNERQGSFILTMNYFLEAAEGHGARFTQTLEQFKALTEE